MNLKLIKFIRTKLFNLYDFCSLFSIFKAILLKSLFIKKLPLFLNIEPTTRCNLRCKFCVNEKYSDEKRADLTLDQFKLILSQFPNVKFLCLNGVGEPLLNKDLFKMVKLAKEQRIYTGFVSNGMLLDKNVAHEALRSKVDWISFSIDSANKEKYEELRKGGCFERLIENIKYLNELKEKSLSYKKTSKLK